MKFSAARFLPHKTITSSIQQAAFSPQNMSDNEAEVNYNERERSRSRDRSFDREYRDEENRHHDAYPPQQQPEDDGENFNMYITNINLQVL